MPILKCQKNKKKGYKFGKRGTCYTGRDGLKKAKRQGRAIEVNKKR